MFNDELMGMSKPAPTEDKSNKVTILDDQQTEEDAIMNKISKLKSKADIHKFMNKMMRRGQAV